MVLTVFERLLLRNIIPQIQGWNYAHMREARELMEGLFTEQEEIDLEIKPDGDNILWKSVREDGSTIPQERDIVISDGLKAKIGKFIDQLQEKEMLQWSHRSLVVKFVGEDKV